MMSPHEILLKSGGLMIMTQNTTHRMCHDPGFLYVLVELMRWCNQKMKSAHLCLYIILWVPDACFSRSGSHTLRLLPPLSFPAQECDEFVDLNLSHAFIGTSVRVRLLLYTNEKGTCGTLMSHADPFAHANFNGSRPTTFLIHGYRPTGSPPMWLSNITKLLLARRDMNLIVVDWNYGAANVNYLKAVKNTHTVADNLTAFVDKLKVRM